MRKSLFLLLFVVLLVCAEKPTASFFQEYFASFTDKAVKKEMHLLCSSDFMERVSLGETFLILDIRTQKERNIIPSPFKSGISCSMNEVFTDENLKKIRSAKGDVIVLCKSGNRAIPITMALRQIGIENVYTLKGGLVGLLAKVGP